MMDTSDYFIENIFGFCIDDAGIHAFLDQCPYALHVGFIRVLVAADEIAQEIRWIGETFLRNTRIDVALKLGRQGDVKGHVPVIALRLMLVQRAHFAAFRSASRTSASRLASSPSSASADATAVLAS